MNKLEDPPRLSDAASETTDGVRAILRAGKRELPTPDNLASLAGRLPLGPLPPPAGPAPAAPPAIVPPGLAAPVAAPSVLSSALLGAVLGLGVVGGVWWRDTASSPAGQRSQPAVAANPGAAIEAPRTVDSRPADPGPGPADPALPRAAIPPSAPRGGPPSEVSAKGQEAEAPSVAGSDAPPPGAGVAADDETEVHLLQRAQGALGADPGAALALTGEHARRYPGGALAQEREFIAVSALLALGRAPEAQGRAARLLERFPSSAYRGRLETLGLGNSLQKDESPSPRTH